MHTWYLEGKGMKMQSVLNKCAPRSIPVTMTFVITGCDLNQLNGESSVSEQFVTEKKGKSYLTGKT